MRAAVLTEFNHDWQLQTLPDPHPAPGQVVVRIRASGMCGTDLHAHHGHLGAKLPIDLGHEPSGRPEHCPTAQSWMNMGGGNSELMLAWASGCALIPEGLAFELAAPIFCG